MVGVNLNFTADFSFAPAALFRARQEMQSLRVHRELTNVAFHLVH